MEMTCKDPVFGEMAYRHRWYKTIKLYMFGKEWDVGVAAKAYSGKSITEEQRRSYSEFFDKIEAMVDIIGENIKKYVNENLYELATDWIGARSVGSVNELAQMVVPKTLLFKQDGTTIMLFDCVWEEHGIAVKTMPEIAIGSQDIFL